MVCLLPSTLMLRHAHPSNEMNTHGLIKLNRNINEDKTDRHFLKGPWQPSPCTLLPFVLGTARVPAAAGFLQERGERDAVHPAGVVQRPELPASFYSGSWVLGEGCSQDRLHRKTTTSLTPSWKSEHWLWASLTPMRPLGDSEPLRTERNQSFPPGQDPCLIRLVC